MRVLVICIMNASIPYIRAVRQEGGVATQRPWQIGIILICAKRRRNESRDYVRTNEERSTVCLRPIDILEEEMEGGSLKREETGQTLLHSSVQPVSLF